jgi:hypothetical protein
VWEAVKIRDVAREKLSALKRVVAAGRDDVDSRHAVRRLFSEARFGFIQARHLAAACPGAHAGLQETIEVMISWCMARDLVTESEALLDALVAPNPVLRARLDAIKARKAIDALRADRLERFGESYERAPTRRGRIILGLAVGLSVVLLTLIVSVYDSLFPAEVTARRLSITTSSLALAAVIGSFLGRRSLYANRLGAHLTSSIVLGFVAGACVAIAGYRLGASGDLIMVAQMLLMCLAMANAYPIIGFGRWGAGFSGAAALASIALPPITHPCLVSCGLVCAGLIVYDWLERDWRLDDPVEMPSPEPA